LPAQGIPAAPVIGGYWTRSNDVEIDIVGADREPVAKQLLFLGSVKWLETGQFDDHDLLALQRHRDRITPDPVPVVAVSRSGTSATHVDAAFTPADLIEAWSEQFGRGGARCSRLPAPLEATLARSLLTELADTNHGPALGYQAGSEE